MTDAFEFKPVGRACDLMAERLRQAGLNGPYLEKAKPALLRAMRNRCARCPTPGRCAVDLEAGDWEAGQGRYCPNAEAVDRLIISRL